MTLPPSLAQRFVTELEASETALENSRVDYFAEHLPAAEHWRLVPEFARSMAYLDIETTGLSKYYHSTTLVGLFKDGVYRAFIAGANMDELADSLEGADILVTFNGKLFDVPFLRSKMPDLPIPQVHLDLRFLARRLGIRGGLKEVEKRLGVRRDSEVEGLDGYDATILWHRYCRGDDNALELLVRYNMEDTVNLRPLLFETVRRLQKQLTSGAFAKGVQSSIEGKTFGKQAYFSKVLPVHDEPLTAKPGIAVRQSGAEEAPIELRIGSSDPVRIRRRRTYPMTLRGLLDQLGPTPPTVVGIDLSASEKRASGWARIVGTEVETAMLRTDQEIIDATVESRPKVVSIDSPLSLPSGRDCTRDDCACRSCGIMRQAERVLKSRGVNVYPCLIRSMQPLTERGMRLASRLRLNGVEVIESYPGAAQDILGIVRKKVDEEELQLGLRDLGADPRSRAGKALVHDELDAVTSAIVGYFYLASRYEPIGDAREGQIIVPQLQPSVTATAIRGATQLRIDAPATRIAAA